MSPRSPNPETEAMKRAKDSQQPPPEENQDPKPPPSEEKKRGKGTGQAPLPRDGI